MSEWNKFSERLPTSEMPILLAWVSPCGKHREVWLDVFYGFSVWGCPLSYRAFSGARRINDIKPTHWMPLPRPPKGDEQ
jgi:hypothetical protein